MIGFIPTTDSELLETLIRIPRVVGDVWRVFNELRARRVLRPDGRGRLFYVNDHGLYRLAMRKNILVKLILRRKQ